MKRYIEQENEQLLEEWCRSLRKLQISGTENPRLDGGILCPACGKIHGRCAEVMAPFLLMEEREPGNGWLEAAMEVFSWAENTVSMPDGSYINDIDSEWKGITVFFVIQLAECLLFHEDLLPEDLSVRLKNRLSKAAEFLCSYDSLQDNNINYPISNALALYECFLVLEEPRYARKAEGLAELAKTAFTEHGLLYGEGVPREKKSLRGCLPVDIGYNVEETLPSLALYGYLKQDRDVMELAETGLEAQQNWALPDGGWDNSFGTRNFKWTYWGSRTSDGCALGYLLYAKKRPDFVKTAVRNLRLLQECTRQGLLMGGPHYDSAGQPICVHHTFTHVKVLASILENQLWDQIPEEMWKDILEAPEDVEKPESVKYYPEISAWQIRKKGIMATVAAYDWEYLPGGHVSGGTLSMLHEETSGPVLCAGMTDYWQKEPNNMQIPYHCIHECLAVRLEKEMGGICFSSVYEDQAEMTEEKTGKDKWEDGVCQIRVSGVLKNKAHESNAQAVPYTFVYRFFEDGVEIEAECANGTLICPVISRKEEVLHTDAEQKQIRIKKECSAVTVESDMELKLPYGEERIFHLTPGLQALRIEQKLGNEKTRIRIRIQKDFKSKEG